jgi:hypothetical protein
LLCNWNWTVTIYYLVHSLDREECVPLLSVHSWRLNAFVKLVLLGESRVLCSVYALGLGDVLYIYYAVSLGRKLLFAWLDCGCDQLYDHEIEGRCFVSNCY